MAWAPLAERFSALPLILAGPLLRRTESHAVTVWLALKEFRTVTLRIYRKDDAGDLIEQFVGTHPTMRLGDHLHLVAITARARNTEEQLAWGELYYYDLFFSTENPADGDVPVTAAHLGTPGVLTNDPALAASLEQLVYPGHPLPSFVLPSEDMNQLRILHGSCRKPDGVGKEMLSTVDSILEDSAHLPVQRPQQLFLTGDQIYADGVAEPLLYALTDAGNFLLVGNTEEILPLVNVPARMLAPGSRTDAVRNQAMFTTKEPENQLLALAEFSAMYLFAWSDVLWPDGFPLADYFSAYPHAEPNSAQYQKAAQKYLRKMEQLREFRSTLPQVRRALANIATYMICDDHDVTDDWFIDGMWCQRVLGSAIGRRIVRNALLAYALFQAWGNTPDQFDEPNGRALLDAVDVWRGDESDTQAVLIDRMIGMPTSFDGSGTLQRSEEALHWHYTFSGPRYQMIVMDTRTQRLYLTPHAFPGLLSPAALEAQVVEARREDAEVTLIVSATPVFGIGLIEAMQFWSRMLSKENDGFDPEAWALERFTFQNFLKAVGAMKRVVILSGDVHYAFGSSLQYWDHCSKATAKIINFTSSPLHNEGSGMEIAALAIGYPYFFHLLQRGEIPPVDFCAWDISTDSTHVLPQLLEIVKSHVYKLWWAVPRLIDMQRSSDTVVLPAQGWPLGAFDAFPPDRSYRLHYLHDIHYQANVQTPSTTPQQGLVGAITEVMEESSQEGQARATPFRIPALEGNRNTMVNETMTLQQHETGQGQAGRGPAPSLYVMAERANSLMHATIKDAQVLEHEVELLEHVLKKDSTLLADALFHHQEWLSHWEAGMLIVGYANIGEIHFEWTPDKKEAIQCLWWWHPGNPACPTLSTEYRDTLELPEFDAAPALP